MELTLSDHITKLSSDVEGAKTILDELESDIQYVYPFNCLPLDLSFNGGIPSGKILEFFGLPASGKSTLALEASKNFAQFWTNKKEKFAIIWLDTENAIDKLRTYYMGCSVENMIFHSIDTVEDAFDIIKKYLNKAEEANIKLLIIYDTIAASPTRNEKYPKQNRDGSENKWSGGRAEKPRVVKLGLETITTQLGRTNSTLILVNQVYNAMNAFVPQIVSPGGEGIKFHSSVRTQLSLKGYMHDKNIGNIGIKTEVNQIKNKLTTPNFKVVISLLFESGLDADDTLYNYLIDNRICDIQGAWKILKLPQKEVKFLNQQGLKEIVSVTNPEVKDWLEYKIIRFALEGRKLAKIKYIDRIWGFEDRFGIPRTLLTEEEKQAYEFSKVIGN